MYMFQMSTAHGYTKSPKSKRRIGNNGITPVNFRRFGDKTCRYSDGENHSVL